MSVLSCNFTVHLHVSEVVHITDGSVILDTYSEQLLIPSVHICSMQEVIVQL